MAAGDELFNLAGQLEKDTAAIMADVVDQIAPAADALLTEAAGRSLLIVVRDAHRYPTATGLVSLLLAARPDAAVIEMGLPVWRPASATYLASYGAARSNALAVAERLGLAAPQVL